MTTPPSIGASPWWRRDRHVDRRPALLARNRAIAAWRAGFAARDFIEVDAAALQISPGNEAHIDAFATDLVSPDRSSRRLYLHASPEFACKKLLAAGEERIFSLGHVFRNGERGPLHHPEFTMLEWYRVGEPLAALIEDCGWIVAAAAEAAGARALRYRDRTCDAFAAAEIVSAQEAFLRHAGVDLLATLSPAGEPDAPSLREACARAGFETASDDSWSDMFSKLLVARVEPRLGLGRPTALVDYPACEAALARRSAADPSVCERFELYACGVELANAFAELTDPIEQRERFLSEMNERAGHGGERYPLDEEFLAALADMPEASGIALGVDRLVMLATGAPRLDEVMWTPVAEGSS
jgi:elongation factor P--(R)-beta-lysine ligase